ncbi:hypothetical protein RDI58_022036 [Solanum bulbocastanum]|uniref:Uncharacterized protein n=1 Tax=Solanum bulbocastanum TaxID=147425 RepID=A0AAN8T7A5_SOLBU
MLERGNPIQVSMSERGNPIHHTTVTNTSIFSSHTFKSDSWHTIIYHSHLQQVRFNNATFAYVHAS